LLAVPRKIGRLRPPQSANCATKRQIPAAVARSLPRLGATCSLRKPFTTKTLLPSPGLSAAFVHGAGGRLIYAQPGFAPYFHGPEN